MYEQALWAARASAAIIIAAASYYWIRLFVVKYHVQVIQNKLPVIRSLHPWIGITGVIFFPLHAYVMLSTFLVDEFSVKIATGLVLALLLSVQIGSGIILKRQSAVVALRMLHRRTMIMLLLTLTIHYLVRLT